MENKKNDGNNTEDAQHPLRPLRAKRSHYRLWVQARNEHGFGTDAYDYEAASKRWRELMAEHGLEG